ncbi:hypothetical protein [Corynebacterium tapiri]|uniref:Uncharacterized protein n=1 Tax=Corynebacterium tapiri TaxID=1448266 RepID=A0A5C4U6R1_9CORY|nr:hypothetical protein [Corynebacterium tapiri]TNL98770.1 hypothetical protein FHE74_03895 [Corynebacterium tapiri]
MYTLKYVAPDGVVFPLIGGPYGAVFVRDGGLESLVASFEDTGVQAAGHAGRRVDWRDRLVKELTGALTVVVRDPALWPGFARAFHSRRHGTLVLDGGALGPMRLSVRLAAPIGPPSMQPKPGTEVQVSLVADDGVWVQSHTGTGNVTVTNYGDVPIWPSVEWDGAGGQVKLPSGATFTLPAVTGRHSVSLSRLDGGEVVDARGRVDQGLTDKAGALSESVPVDFSRTFSVPTGARLSWSVGYFSPWR